MSKKYTMSARHKRVKQLVTIAQSILAKLDYLTVGRPRKHSKTYIQAYAREYEYGEVLSHTQKTELF